MEEAMPNVGVRELKTHASEIIRSLREKRTRYVVTYRGRPVALLMPLDTPPYLPSDPDEAVWNELTRLGEAIGQEWRSPLTSAELLSNMRR
jgi:prevent-host-death family protein